MKTNAKKIGFSILYALSRAGRAIANFFKDAFKHMPYAFHVVIHPFDGFFRLKTETRRHSVPARCCCMCSSPYRRYCASSR